MISLAMCCLRCIICGYACCSCCCGGCGGRKTKRNQHAYPVVAPMGPAPVWGDSKGSPYVTEEPMRYAYFDSKPSDDALPIMPSLGEREEYIVEDRDFKSLEAGYELQSVRPVDSAMLSPDRLPQPTPQRGLVDDNGFLAAPQRRPSHASSFYSEVAVTAAPPGQQHRRTLSPQALAPPRPLHNQSSGHRNTYQREYNEVQAVNPYQYDYRARPPPVRETPYSGSHDRQNTPKPEEWTVI